MPFAGQYHPVGDACPHGVRMPATQMLPGGHRFCVADDAAASQKYELEHARHADAPAALYRPATHMFRVAVVEPAAHE